jgi:hypothetical protein
MLPIAHVRKPPTPGGFFGARQPRLPSSRCPAQTRIGRRRQRLGLPRRGARSESTARSSWTDPPSLSERPVRHPAQSTDDVARLRRNARGIAVGLSATPLAAARRSKLSPTWSPHSLRPVLTAPAAVLDRGRRLVGAPCVGAHGGSMQPAPHRSRRPRGARHPRRAFLRRAVSARARARCGVDRPPRRASESRARQRRTPRRAIPEASRPNSEAPRAFPRPGARDHRDRRSAILQANASSGGRETPTWHD